MINLMAKSLVKQIQKIIEKVRILIYKESLNSE